MTASAERRTTASGAKRLRRAAEIGSWALAVTLLVAFAAGRFIGGFERDRSLDTFRAVRASSAASAPGGSMIAPPARLVAASPDQSDWSQARRVQYASVGPDPSNTREPGALPAAVLRIARVGFEVPVFAEETERNMNRGAVLVAGTATPGSEGNVAIAAHRDGYFRVLEQVVAGDVVEVVTLARAQRYRITTLSIVSPDDTTSLRPTSYRALTLVTCYPFRFVGSAPRRYVVRAAAID